MQLNLPIIIGTALTDAINPAAFGVLIYLLSKIAKPHRLVATASTFIGVFFISHFLLAIIFLPIINQLNQTNHFFYNLVGIFLFLSGLINFIHYMAQKKFSFPQIFTSPQTRINAYCRNTHDDFLAIALLSFSLSILELPFAANLYIGLLTLLPQNPLVISLSLTLILYNLLLITPLILISLYIYYRLPTQDFIFWKKHPRSQIIWGTYLLTAIIGLWILTT